MELMAQLSTTPFLPAMTTPSGSTRLTSTARISSQHIGRPKGKLWLLNPLSPSLSLSLQLSLPENGPDHRFSQARTWKGLMDQGYCPTLLSLFRPSSPSFSHNTKIPQITNPIIPKKLWVSLTDAGSGNFLSASSFFFEGFIPSGVAT